MTRMVAVACLVLCLGACGEDDPGPPVHLGESESGQAVVLSVGQELVVTLPSNPSTGYAWSFQSSSSGVLRAGDSEYVPTPPVLPGSGGQERFTFTGAAEGRTTLRFEYRRAFETGVPAARVIEYAVVVG